MFAGFRLPPPMTPEVRRLLHQGYLDRHHLWRLADTPQGVVLRPDYWRITAHVSQFLLALPLILVPGLLWYWATFLPPEARAMLGWMFVISLLGISVVTLIGTIWQAAADLRQGPWLTIDERGKCIVLPRQGTIFHFADIHWLLIHSINKIDRRDSHVFELMLVATAPEQPREAISVRAYYGAASQKAVESFAEALAQHTHSKVIRSGPASPP